MTGQHERLEGRVGALPFEDERVRDYPSSREMLVAVTSASEALLRPLDLHKRERGLEICTH